MRNRIFLLAVCLSALPLVGCGDDDDPVIDGGLGRGDGGLPDAAEPADGAVEPPDASEEDGGLPDASEAPDAGEGDAGAEALEPIKPGCENFGGGDECIKEWLKEVDSVDFSPVAVGELGAGPWPTTALEHLRGLDGRILGVGVDTGQNQYAVSSEALFIRRVGEAAFTKYPRGTNGLREYRLLSVAGGGPGKAYVGYRGEMSDTPDLDPLEMRKSGDVQALTLEPGGFSALTWDTHNSNTPVSGKYDHSRQIYEIHVPRRGPAAGEVYLGTEHGIVRYQGRYYFDHAHIDTVVNGSQRFGYTRAMAVTDAGTVWYGNEFAFGGKAWTPRLYEWELGRWIFPTWAFGSREERDYYEGIGVDSTGRGVWAAGRSRGVVRMTIAENGRSAVLDNMRAPDSFMRDLVVDLDDSVWLGADSGLYRYFPESESWSKVSGVPGGIEDLFLDDTVSPRALYIAHGSGVSVYRGP